MITKEYKKLLKLLSVMGNTYNEIEDRMQNSDDGEEVKELRSKLKLIEEDAKLAINENYNNKLIDTSKLYALYEKGANIFNELWEAIGEVWDEIYDSFCDEVDSNIINWDDDFKNEQLSNLYDACEILNDLFNGHSIFEQLRDDLS